MKKIYVETTCLSNKFNGISRAIEFLLATLCNCGIDIVRIEKKDFGKNISNFIYFNKVLPQYLKTHVEKNDIFLIPNNMGKFWHLPDVNTWVIMHDTIPLSSFGYSKIKRFFYKLKNRQLKKATKIIAISETVKKDIHDKFNVPFERIDVLYWPCIPTSSLCKLQIECDPKFKIKDFGKYILSIGTGEPRKYVEFIIRNWDKIAPKDFNLVLFGGEWIKGAHDALKELASKTNSSNRIHVIGRVSDEELDILYTMAEAFIFPSLEEGFGLPPLESLSHGTPIILPKTPINYELYSEIAQMYSINNIDQLRSCILKVSKNFSVDSFCEKFGLEVFKKNILNIFTK